MVSWASWPGAPGERAPISSNPEQVWGQHHTPSLVLADVLVERTGLASVNPGFKS